MNEPAERGIMGIVKLSVAHRMQREVVEKVQEEVSAHGMQALVEVDMKFAERDSVRNTGGGNGQEQRAGCSLTGEFEPRAIYGGTGRTLSPIALADSVRSSGALPPATRLICALAYPRPAARDPKVVRTSSRLS